MKEKGVNVNVEEEWTEGATLPESSLLGVGIEPVSIDEGIILGVIV